MILIEIIVISIITFISFEITSRITLNCIIEEISKLLTVTSLFNILLIFVLYIYKTNSIVNAQRGNNIIILNNTEIVNWVLEKDIYFIILIAVIFVCSMLGFLMGRVFK